MIKNLKVLLNSKQNLLIIYYNNERIKLRLKGKSPIQYRIDFERVA